MGQVFVNVSWK